MLEVNPVSIMSPVSHNNGHRGREFACIQQMRFKIRYDVDEEVTQYSMHIVAA